MAMCMQIRLVPLQQADREQFIRDNQEAFRYGALEESGSIFQPLEEGGEIIFRASIEASIEAESSKAYRILADGKYVGGMVLNLNLPEEQGDLELFFIHPQEHNKGIGTAAWHAVERLHSDIRIWTTFTPYFEKWNIHFYVNRLGFQIDEFFHKGHWLHADADDEYDEGPDEMFHFVKYVRVKEKQKGKREGNL